MRGLARTTERLVEKMYTRDARVHRQHTVSLSHCTDVWRDAAGQAAGRASRVRVHCRPDESTWVAEAALLHDAESSRH